MNKQSSDKLVEEGSSQGQLFNLDGGLVEDNLEQRNLSDEEKDELLISLLAISSIKGIGFKTLKSMNASSFLLDFKEMSESEIARRWLDLEVKPKTDYSKIINKNRNSLLNTGEQEVEKLKTQGITFIPLGHKSYPLSLLRLENPPHWLFIKGNITPIYSSSIIGVIGTREPSDSGRRLAYRCAEELTNKNFIVLSGLAKGIDEAAHTGTIDNFGQTVAVFGHGITPRYSSLNNDLIEGLLDCDGVIISEYLPEDPPSRERFLRRNELQAALSKAIIPIELSSLKSGTGSTIRRATAIGTPVIGIVPQDTSVESLLQTKTILLENDFPVFEVLGSNSIEFWAYLKVLLPNHDWSFKPVERQDRFFRSLERQVIEICESIRLDDDAIDRFASRLKEKLREIQNYQGGKYD